MTRAPNRPCAACGKLLWATRGSTKPQVCRECVRGGRRPEPGQSWGNLRFIGGSCAWCGEAFLAIQSCRGSRGAGKYCSVRCSLAFSKKLEGRFRIPPNARLAIYQRDGWLCQLCGEPTDPKADPLSDWYPSLDHIEPQSAALIPDHSERNLRTAHRWCNAVRGNKETHPLFEGVA